MKEYQYLARSYDVFGKVSYEGHFVYYEDALKALEVHQQTLPYTETAAIYEVKHWIKDA